METAFTRMRQLVPLRSGRQIRPVDVAGERISYWFDSLLFRRWESHSSLGSASGAPSFAPFLNGSDSTLEKLKRLKLFRDLAPWK
jgi:hypothetical protein